MRRWNQSGHRVLPLLVVIGDLNVEGVSILPAEANAVLVVDPNAVLPFAIARQGFELVAGDRGQVARRDCPVSDETVCELQSSR